MTAPVQQYRDAVRSWLRVFIKDDEILLDNVLLTCFSSFTPDPINLGVMGPSSAGKSYPISLVTSLFPNAEVLTGASAKAFFYDNGTYVDEDTHEPLQDQIDELRRRLDADEKDVLARAELRRLMKRAMMRVSLEGRILVFLEPPDQSLFEALKPILSHDKWDTLYKTVDKGSSGELRTRKILLAGWPAFIFASAKELDSWAMWPELKSRCVLVTPNMSPDKYGHANELSAKLLGQPAVSLRNLIPRDLEQEARDDVQGAKTRIEMLSQAAKVEGNGSVRDGLVFNPFAAKLSSLFPHDDPSSMRKFRSLLKYVNLIALSEVYNRPGIIVRDQKRGAVATLSDVQRAVALVYASILADVPGFKLTFYEKVLVPLYESSVVVTNDTRIYVPLTTKQILAEIRRHGRGMTSDSLRKTFLIPLENAGLIASDEDERDGRAKAYTPIPIAQNYRKLRDRRNFDVESLKASLKRLQADSGDEVVNYTYPDGKIVSNLEEFAAFLLDLGGMGDPIPPDDKEPQPPEEPLPPDARVDAGDRMTSTEPSPGPEVPQARTATPTTSPGETPGAPLPLHSGEQVRKQLRDSVDRFLAKTAPPQRRPDISDSPDTPAADPLIPPCERCGAQRHVGELYVLHRTPYSRKGDRVCKKCFLEDAETRRKAETEN